MFSQHTHNLFWGVRLCSHAWAIVHLTLVTLKGQCQRHSDFEGLYLVNEPSSAMCYYWTPIGTHIWEVQQHN